MAPADSVAFLEHIVDLNEKPNSVANEHLDYKLIGLVVLERILHIT